VGFPTSEVGTVRPQLGGGHGVCMRGGEGKRKKKEIKRKKIEEKKKGDK
jgi:hypothetical protein